MTCVNPVTPRDQLDSKFLWLSQNISAHKIAGGIDGERAEGNRRRGSSEKGRKNGRKNEREGGREHIVVARFSPASLATRKLMVKFFKKTKI